MPELPDVEHFRRYFDATALHQEIVAVEIHSRQVLATTQTAALKEGIVHHTFEATDRHGKHLFARLDNDRWLRLHFGMSGGLSYFKRMEDDPQYDRLLITFANGYHLAYTSQRKLGEITLLDDKAAFIEQHDLGTDVLSDAMDLAHFQALLADRRGMIKSALMDQHLMSGIGNVYSDEILFQAGIHPRAKVMQLDEEQITRIYHKMREVLKTAIEHQADPAQFPPSYLTPHREVGASCPRCEGEVSRVKVSGRNAYYCPTCQSK